MEEAPPGFNRAVLAHRGSLLLHFTRDTCWVNKHQNLQVQVERLYDVWNRWSDGGRGCSGRRTFANELLERYALSD